MKISASLEDYLYAVYKLNPDNTGTRVTDISEFLKVQKSSTNSALKQLKEQGYLNYEKYKNINLTEMGKVRAKHIDKKKEIFKKFLLDIIKTDEKLVNIEAEHLAHGISCHTTAKLEEFIENISTNEA